MKSYSVSKLKKYYKSKKVVSTYVKDRFDEPKGKLLHMNQVNTVNSIITSNNLQTALELALGPARVTKDIVDIKGVGIDSSNAMLKVAKKELIGKNWSLIKKNIFKLNLHTTFDLVYSFRFIRHFKYNNRVKCYNVVKRHLNKAGYFIFDAGNYEVEYPIRKRIGFEKFKAIYDELWMKDDLLHELEANGFKDIILFKSMNFTLIQSAISKLTYILKIPSIGYSIISFLDNFKIGKPVEWVVICKKK